MGVRVGPGLVEQLEFAGAAGEVGLEVGQVVEIGAENCRWGRLLNCRVFLRKILMQIVLAMQLESSQIIVVFANQLVSLFYLLPDVQNFPVRLEFGPVSATKTRFEIDKNFLAAALRQRQLLHGEFACLGKKQHAGNLALLNQRIDFLLNTLTCIITRRQVGFPFDDFEVEVAVQFVDLCDEFENAVTLGSKFTGGSEENFEAAFCRGWFSATKQIKISPNSITQKLHAGIQPGH